MQVKTNPQIVAMGLTILLFAWPCTLGAKPGNGNGGGGGGGGGPVNPSGNEIIYTENIHGDDQLESALNDGSNQATLTSDSWPHRAATYSHADSDYVAFIDNREGGGWGWWCGGIYILDVSAVDNVPSLVVDLDEDTVCYGSLTTSRNVTTRGTRLDFSPDQAFLTFVGHDADDNVDLYTVEVATGEVTKHVLSVPVKGGAAWSPDLDPVIPGLQTKIAFAEKVESVNSDLSVLEAEIVDGVLTLGAVSNLTAGEGLDRDGRSPDWSADGSEIVHHRDAGLYGGIYITAADGSSTVFVTGGYGARFSPDASQLAMTKWHSWEKRKGKRVETLSDWDIFRTDRDGSGEVNISDSSSNRNSEVDWRP